MKTLYSSLVCAALAATTCMAGSVDVMQDPMVTNPYPEITENRICFSEHPTWEKQPAEKLRQRYELYKEIGCQMIRIHTEWNAFEKSEGHWDEHAYDDLLDEVKRAQFKIKLIAGVMMAPPRWFYEKNPDARMIDQYGEYSKNCISHWYPEMEQVLKSRLEKILDTLKGKDMLHLVEYIVIDLGPAGEGIYPANWTMGRTDVAQAFACYSPLAQADFRKHMQAKYDSLAAANKAWGTEFADWASVEIPMPKTITGQFWEDMLFWYRDTKRNTFRVQIENVVDRIKDYGLDAKPLVYLPGAAINDDDIRKAAKGGGGHNGVRLMIDNEYLMEIADSYGCILQNTGFENIPEVKRMKKRMVKAGVDYTTVWGENAGVLRCAKDPIHLARIVLDENLWGIDYTHTRFAFEEDHVTPNARFALLAEAGRIIRKYYSSGKKPDFSKYDYDADAIPYSGSKDTH
ncbi:Unannotated [Lentimonas sp. CC4]|nr:Unannotated [Lentimonas sp. CC4]CAA6686360.1 Unannotated [Lentimonas sp. CC6]CAA7076134.1 Unannotated [Lentimonas sp. CC4]CAA7170873.1 Unannotated [Lentimonas sp. CC21]CAA7181185.1 Unannotated [Lentimonas sp. CC8]